MNFLIMQSETLSVLALPLSKRTYVKTEDHSSLRIAARDVRGFQTASTALTRYTARLSMARFISFFLLP